MFALEKATRERRVKAIDEGDYSVVAGKYTELDGDIAMLLADGDASLTNLDALIAVGGRPANYTEYGGDLQSDKVYDLSKAALHKPACGGTGTSAARPTTRTYSGR